MNEFLNTPHAVKAMESIGLAVVVFLLAKLATRIATKRGKRISETPFVIEYTAIFFFAISLVFIWLESLAPVLTALTIVAAALTIVAKELILNFLGSFVIFWRELFAVGDRVTIGENSGDVISKGILYFTLLETGGDGSTGHSTGRMVKVPNALALTTPLINGTRGAGYVWNELNLVIERSGDWAKARDHMLAIVDDYYREAGIDLAKIKTVFESRGIFFNKLTPRAYVDVADNGIRLTIRYLCRARLVRDSNDFITTRFLTDMDSLNVALADGQS